MDHGHKRAVIQDTDVEQSTKRHPLEGEGQASASATAAPLTAEELKYEEEVNEDSASSDEEEISATKIHSKRILSDKRNDKSV